MVPRDAPSLDFYKAVTDNMSEGLYATDAQGCVTFMNAAAETMLGWTFDELKGRRMHDVTHHHHPDGRPFPVEECPGFQVLRNGRRLHDVDDTFICRDGRFLPVSYSSSPLRTDGVIVGLVVVFRDASERRLIEQDARLLQQLGTELIVQDDPASFYQKMVDGAAKLMRSDFASMQMFRPERGTAGELQLLAHRGFRAEDCSGWQWVGPEVGTTCGAALRTGVRVVAPDTEDSPYRDAYHATAIRSVQSTPLFSRTGALVGMLSTHWNRPYDPPQRDLRNLDILARQAADIIDWQRALQEGNRRKDEFLALLAHELRNPLAPIRNALSIISTPTVDGDAAGQARRIIGRQLDQMVRLIDDLVDANRISRGRLELRRQRVELAPIVREAVESSRPAGGVDDAAKQITVQLPAEPIYMDADPVRLFQILCNLLNNAHKFTRAGDRIRLSAEREDGHVVLIVEDTGIGIPAEELGRVFDMFLQLDRSPKVLNAGLGIGLALVKQLVNLHGGSIEAKSDGLGKGSTFTVRLPLYTELPDTVAEERGGLSQSATPRRVLIVDDNRDSADSLAELLTMGGHQTRVAYDGEDALVVAADYRPDVLLLDIGLPTLDGYEVCRRIREQPWGRQIPIIAITGWGAEQDRGRTRAAGFSAHLVKPIQNNALAKLLASAPPNEAHPI